MICLRPSKTFLFTLLNEELSKSTGEVGLDAGSNAFKNRPMFKTKKYFGLDIDLAAIQKGMRIYPDKNSFGILADLTRLDFLPSDSVDVIASTNTLYVLNPKDRATAINHLARIITPRGKLVLEYLFDRSLDEEICELQKKFKHVKVCYFKSIISRTYESLFEINGFLGSHPLAGTKPFLAISLLLSKLEYLTCKFRWPNRHVLITCSDKVVTKQKIFLDTDKLKMIQEKLFTSPLSQ